MELYKKKGLELISNLAITNKKMPSVVKYTPAKTKICAHSQRTLPVSIPERVGISSSVILSLLSDLEKEEKSNIHSIVIVKDGFLIADCSRRGYSSRLAHLSHSMSKTVTGMLIGMLVDDGRLAVEDNLAKFFSEYDIHPDCKGITVENLLTMSSGIEFSEIGAVTDTRWTETFLGSEPAFIPGEKFAYNSMNSYILMVIAHKIINEHYGVSVSDFLKKRLFSPLGISDFFWEKGPEDIEKGGWGLYLSAEAWAKLGMMMLQNGNFNGKKILSKEWVSASASTRAITPKETGDFNYGYQLWVGRENDDFLFNGMLGQNVLVIPKNNIVVAISAGNNELFQESPSLKIIRERLGRDIDKLKLAGERALIPLRKKLSTFLDGRLWIEPKEKRHGIKEFFGLRTKTPFDEDFTALLGKFRFAENNQGILPLFVRTMQNNYQGGIEEFEFTRSGNDLILTVTEGGEKFVYKLGIYGYEFSEINYAGEKYTVGTLTHSKAENEWLLEFIYPELPNTRRLRLSKEGENILTVSMTETPDSKITEAFITSIPAMSPKINFAIDLLETNLGKNFIERRVAEIFSPTLRSVSENAENFELLLDEENQKINEALSSMRIVRMLIGRITGAEDDFEGKKQSIGGFVISSLISKFFSRNKGEKEPEHNEK